LLDRGRQLAPVKVGRAGLRIDFFLAGIAGNGETGIVTRRCHIAPLVGRLHRLANRLEQGMLDQQALQFAFQRARQCGRADCHGSDQSGDCRALECHYIFPVKTAEAATINNKNQKK